MKKLVSLLFISICLLFGLTACNQPSSVYGKFSQEKYVVNINDSIDFKDLLNLNGTSFDQIEISFSETGIIEERENKWIAVQSGSVQVFANYNNLVVAQTNVVVNYKFDSPKEVEISKDGVLKWEESVVNKGDKLISALQYIVKIGNDKEYLVSENCFNFKENEFLFGEYEVKIQAVGIEKENILSSNVSQTFSVVYDYVSLLEGLNVSVSEIFLNQTATLSWASTEGVIYDIYFNDFKVNEKKLSQSSFSYDFSKYSNGSIINVRIIGYDEKNEKLSSSIDYQLQKLNSVTPSYKYYANEGFLVIEDNQECLGYILHWSQLDGENSGQKIVNKGEEFLDELTPGVYNISLQALGGNKEGKLYLSSNNSQTISFAKLDCPEIETIIEDEGIQIKFLGEENQYSSLFNITIGNYNAVYDIANGDTLFINSSYLKTGENTLKVKNLPAPEEQSSTGVKYYISNDVMTNRVIDSSYCKEYVYLLSEIKNIIHSFDEETGEISSLTFNNILFADDFELKINGQLETNIDRQIGSTQTTITFSNLSSFQPNDEGAYVFTIRAFRKDGKAISSYGQKTLKILQAPTRQDAENGQFSWGKVEGSASYDYTIYTLDSYGGNEELYIENNTLSTSLNKALSFGYYKIKIVSRSLDCNNYLDSDFKDPNNVLEENFYVYEKIASPKIEFIEEDGVYKVKIFSVDYAGRFTIFLDDTRIDSFEIAEEQSSYTRTLVDQKFEEEKSYNLTVVAGAGNLFDDTLHVDSNPASIEVVRIMTPNYSIQEEYSSTGGFGIANEIGRKTSENFIVDCGIDEAFVDYYQIKINQEIKNIDGENSINLIDQQNTFEITVTAVAKQAVDNSYYLDSKERRIVVRRLNQPSKLSYNLGEVSVEENNEGLTERYYVQLQLFLESGNRETYFFVDNNEFSLQEKIDDFLQNDSFSMEFAQTTQIGIKVYSYLSPKEVNGEIVLMSKEALTQELKTQLIIYKMEATALTFDVETEIISWNRVGENTVYDIYVNDQLQIADYSSNSIKLNNLIDNLDLTQSKAMIYVVAKNDSFLTSNSSNVIEITKLSNIEKIQIIEQDGVWKAGISLEKQTDLLRIDKVLVNGELIQYQEGQSLIIIDLSQYAEESFSLNIKLLAKNFASSDSYYLNSEETSFDLNNVSSSKLEVQTQSNKIVWTSPYQNWQNESGLVYYVVYINYFEQEYSFILTQSEIELDQIEKLIKNNFENGAEVYISIKAKIKTFELTINDTANFGNVEGEKILIEKSQGIENANISISLAQTEDLLLQQINSKVLVKFENIWDEKVVSFDIIINSDIKVENISLISPTEDCSLSLQDNNYTLSLSSRLLRNVGENLIEIKTHIDNTISSNLKSFSIYRNSDVVYASLSADGILHLEYGDYAKDTLLVKLIVGDQTSYQIYSTLTQDLDLTQFLQGKSGGIEIQLIVSDSQLNQLSSQIAYKISQVKLAGISNITLTNSGQIYFTIANTSYDQTENNIEFIIKDEESNIFVFNPIQTANLFVYEYSLQSIVNLLNVKQEGTYNLKIATRVVNSINSDFVDFELRFKIEKEENVLKTRESQISDYILFKLSNDTTTTGLRFLIKDMSGEIVQQTNIDLTNNESIYKGYWDYNSDKFTSVIPEGENYIACYGVSINELMENIEYGQFMLEVCRITKSENNYFIYSIKQFELIKLNNVVEDLYNPLSIAIENNILKWNWIKPNSEELPDNFVPTAFLISFNPIDADLQKQYIITTNNFYDLRQAQLSEGYNILTIQAISENQNIIASSTLNTSLTPYKYSQTKSITLENGKIVFNLYKEGSIDKSIDFVKVFDTSISTNIADNLASIGENGFKDIYYFQTTFVGDQTIKLKFVATDAQGIATNGKVYYATVNALDLLPNFVVGSTSFLEQLKNYIDTHQGSLEINYQNLVSFYEKIKDMGQGLTDGKILFDDFGEEIPAGFYNVSTMQTATNIYDDYIDSEPSSSKLIYISPQASSNLTSTFNEESGEEIYKANFNVVDFANNFGDLEKSYNYVLLFRTSNNSRTENVYRFEISFTSSWSLRYEDLLLENIISGDENGFSINFTMLSQVQKDGTLLIDKTKQYSVYLYSVGKDLSCYGKSCCINLTFLNLENSNLSVENGYLIVSTSKNEVGSDILIKFRKKYGSSSEIQQQIIRMGTNEQGRVIINDALPYSGLYDYVIFNVMGQIDNDNLILKLPSSSYGILNVYKLYQPQLYTSQNKLVISAQTNDSQYGPFKYQLNNGEIEYVSDLQFFDSDSGNLSLMTFNHNDLNIDGLNYVKFLSVSRSNIIISENTETIEGVPYFGNLVNLDNLVLSSETTDISLSKLSNLTEFKIENGNLIWNSYDESIQQVSDEFKVIYKVQVDYYDRTGFKKTQDFWTMQNFMDTILIESSYTQGIGAYFDISLFVYLGKVSEEGQSLVEGGFVDINDAVVLGNNAQVLHSSPILLNGVYKDSTPSFVNDNQTYEGEIAILRDQDRSFAINLVKNNGQLVKLVEGVDFEIKEGKVILSDNTSVNAYFINLLNESYATKESFSLEIYSFSDNKIKSEKLQTKSLYKFATPTQNQLQIYLEEIKNGEYENYLSLESYFNNNKFSYSNNMYQIVFRKNNADEPNLFSFDSQNLNLSIEEYDEGEYLTFVKPKPDQYNYLKSNDFVFNITKVTETGDFEVVFDESGSRFVWTYHNQETYNFFVKINYEDGSIESNYTKDNFTKDGELYYYFQPSKMGNIQEIIIYTQKYLQQDNEICLYYKTISLKGDWAFNLFESGSGTQADPYVVKTPEQFANISLRDDVNNKVYFVLGNSITLTSSEVNNYLINDFYGELDGGGYSITYRVESSSQLQGSIDYSLYLGSSTSQIKFNNSQSIIKNICEGASIKNLTIDLYVNPSQLLNYSPTIFCGLATENSGTISNCVIDIKEMIFAQNINSIAISGLVGINKGTIQNCNNISQLQTNYPASSMNLFYGGISLLNLNQGIVEGCQNFGTINLTIRKDNSGLYLGGIVCENNKGQIKASGNNADITISSNNYSYDCAVAGVVSRNAGQINYVFNNGTISSAQSVAGIIYYYRSGNIGELFEMSGIEPVGAIYGSSASQSGNIYAYTNKVLGISVTALPGSLEDGEEFVCNDQYSLIIKKETDNLKIELVLN